MPDTDFHHALDLAGESALDATCALRAAGAKRLPAPHRRLLNSAIYSLEKAQSDVWKLRNDPWTPSRSPKPHQLELL